MPTQPLNYDSQPTGAIINNRYRILAAIGAGGMSRVYRAEDTRLGIGVAVKENLQTGLSGRDEALRQFEQEARLLAKLSHPNLPKVSDHFFDEATGRQYLVMEYIEGEDLEKIVQRAGRLSEPVALNWLGQVLDALEYMHRQEPPVLHRDIKPANIKITPQGKAVLVDFGLVKLAGQGTLTGARAVTPGYSPPEQYGLSTNTRSDIYALGATLYTLLTGQIPPEAPVLMAGDRPLIPPRQVVPTLTPALEAAMLKAMAMKTTDRWNNVAIFRQALTGGPLPPTPSKPIRPPTAANRTRSAPAAQPAGVPIWVWGAVGAMMVLLCLIGITLLRGGGSSRPTPLSATAVPAVPISDIPASNLATAALPTAHSAAGAPTATNTRVLPPPASFATPLPFSADTPVPGSTTSAELPGAILDLKNVPMALVPAGSFLMGDENGEEDDRPVHPVAVDNFYMDQYEVTNARYAACVDRGACSPPSNFSSYSHSNYYNDPQYADYPVVFVNWDQANAYCRWRGGRLPSEAEWEKAARGTDNRTYPWGNEPPDCSRANFWDCVGDTSVVGAYPKGQSPYQVYDLAGNVWEWLADWYDPGYYALSPWTNPTGPDTGGNRGIRGGSWYHSSADTRATSRNGQDPTAPLSHVGFRCVINQAR